MNEVVKVVDGQIELAQEVVEELKRMNEVKATLEMKEKEVKAAVLKAMEDNDIKSFENDDIRITYVAATTRNTVDSAALKEQGLYEQFLKTSNVKASVRMEYK